jgi:diguanylate cyclase (GGDEF)-like protein
MKKLADLITADNMGEILGHVHAMVALVEGDGALVSWNPAFDAYREKSPGTTKLQECFPADEKAKITDKLNAKRRDQFVVELGPDAEEKTIFCDCVFIPLSDERQIFIAEHFDTDKSVHEIIQRLSRRVDMFQVESESAKKIASNKQKEVDAVVAQVDELSNVDALTFLPNRRMVVRKLQDEVLRAQRYNTPLSISVVDVDFFKKVNDAFGHLVGDEVLRHIAYQLRDHIRHPDVVGRYGGEEFLILLPNTSATEAADQAARLCKWVREAEVPVNRHILKVTISIGVAQLQPSADTWDALLNRADNAMYEAKKKGRDRWSMAE